MIVKIDADEWYPVYTIDNELGDDEVVLSEETIARIEAAYEEFCECQGILGDAVRDSRKPHEQAD